MKYFTVIKVGSWASTYANEKDAVKDFNECVDDESYMIESLDDGIYERQHVGYDKYGDMVIICESPLEK